MAKKRKPATTARIRDLQADWQRVLDEHQKWPKFHSGPPPKRVEPKLVDVDYRKLETRLLATYTPHGGTANPSKMYTGTQVKGIAVMHKSCLQPIFSQQEAEDSAKMRR